MPVITMALGTGQLKAERKQDFISGVTTLASEITAIPEASFVVLIEEYETDNVGVGGVSLKQKLATAMKSA